MGEITFDRQVDFRFNAGPLEKIESGLGKLGELLGMMTDKILTYHVTGTLDEPEYAVRPFGIGVE